MYGVTVLQHNFDADCVRWRRHWRRSGWVSQTIEDYIIRCRAYLDWCEQTERSSTALDSADEWIGTLEDHSVHAARWACRALRAYGRFLVSDGQLERHPWLIKLPVEPAVQNARTASTIDLQRLLATCRPAVARDGVGASWTHLRDRAILLTLAHTGMRRGECCSMTIDDIDLVGELVRLPKTKNKTTRTIALHEDAVGAILAYLRASDGERRESVRALWLSCQHRPMVGLTPSGMSQMLDRRGDAAGVDVRAHAFRRRHAGEWMKRGGSESGLMTNSGWKSSAMIIRYSKDTLEQNSIDESRRLFSTRAP